MTKKLLSLLFIISLLSFSGCTEPESAPSEDVENPFDQLTMNELAKHNSAEGCWLLIDGNIYDVTEFVVSHPGEEAILEGCGIDSTEYYETRPMGSGTPHSDGARAGLENYLLGPLTQ